MTQIRLALMYFFMVAHKAGILPLSHSAVVTSLCVTSILSFCIEINEQFESTVVKSMLMHEQFTSDHVFVAFSSVLCTAVINQYACSVYTYPFIFS